MRFGTFAVLMLAAAFQATHPEMTEADIAQIEAEVEAVVLGLYDLVWFKGTSGVHGELAGGSMEFKTDSTWVLSVSYEDLGAPVTSWGGYTVTGERDGCALYESWPEDSRDDRESNIICNGVLSLRHGWHAVFKKGD